MYVNIYIRKQNDISRSVNPCGLVIAINGPVKISAFYKISGLFLMYEI